MNINIITNIKKHCHCGGISNFFAGCSPWNIGGFGLFMPYSTPMPQINFNINKPIFDYNWGNFYPTNNNFPQNLKLELPSAEQLWGNFNTQNNMRFGFNSDTFIRTTPDNSSTISDYQKALVEKAYSYVGKVNSDSEGNRLFSNGREQAWCADFVTYVTRETYGDKLPTTFGSSSVNDLRTWGINNDCYKVIPNQDKATFIMQNIKPGDIMIEKSGGKSHTGIVKEVKSDGSFVVIEGNSDNKVQTKTYSANSNTLSGFVTLSAYA